MSFILDSSVAIPLRDGHEKVIARVSELRGEISLSILTRIELEGGVLKIASDAAERRQRLDALRASVPVLDFDAACAEAYRRILEAAGYSRRKVLDRMIAAQALVHRASLVTFNGDDFRDVPGLRVVEW